MREKKEEKQISSLPVYESLPPRWLPKIHDTADLGQNHLMHAQFEHYLTSLFSLGYVGFHPPRPGQDEDTLSESNVKSGFILPQPVPVSPEQPRWSMVH